MFRSIDWPIVGLVAFGCIILFRTLWTFFYGVVSPGQDVGLGSARGADLSAKEILKHAHSSISERLKAGALPEELDEEASRDIDIGASGAVYFLEQLFKVGNPYRRFPRALIESVIAENDDTDWTHAGFMCLVHDAGFVEYDSDEDEYALSGEFFAEVRARVDAQAKDELAISLVESVV
ncbi:hypothetical protein IPJ70_03420 [Candidatus Campbellbacteria bacterium]|nr:MAG: hypothetical protein IPJ70_03420 [Candidatus Campbellbacteria bacterium]